MKITSHKMFYYILSDMKYSRNFLEARVGADGERLLVNTADKLCKKINSVGLSFNIVVQNMQACRVVSCMVGFIKIFI